MVRRLSHCGWWGIEGRLVGFGGEGSWALAAEARGLWRGRLVGFGGEGSWALAGRGWFFSGEGEICWGNVWGFWKNVVTLRYESEMGSGRGAVTQFLINFLIVKVQ